MYKENTSKKLRIMRLTAALLLVCQFAFGTLIAQSPSPTKSPKKSDDKKSDDKKSDTNDEPELRAENVDTSKYPSTTVNFSIEKQGSVFRQLESSDVEVLLDGKKVALKPDALRKDKDSDPVKVLFVIDKSGSMKVGADKLQAAKDAINNFVNNLSPIDEVAVSTFGVDYSQVLSLTKVENKSKITGAIDGIEAPDAFTNFYNSVEKAVAQADKAEIKNIIFLSDGKEDNADFNKLADKKSEKESREKSLSDDLNKKGIRFFAVAIGNPEADPSAEEYVDFDTMKEIANPTQGKADLVNMPEINAEAKGDKEKSKNLIADKLKGQLAEIKKALKFSYALVFDLPRTDKTNGEMLLNFNITDGNKKWRQSTTYPYTFKDGRPIFEKARVAPFLLSSAGKALNFGDISLIFLLMLLPLGFLSTIPAIFNKFAAVAEERKVNEAIVSVNPGSHLIGAQCPNESGPWGKRYAFNQGDTLIVCPKCATPHHLACWADNKFQCMNRVCESRYQIPEQILARHNVQV